jgi:hypothetical protein
LHWQLGVRANAGVRFREGSLNNIFSASSALNVRQPFRTWMTLNLRFAYFSTQFTKGYRPDVSMRVPVTRSLSLDFSGGSYIYQTGRRGTRSHWLEADGYYRINRILYANVGYRMFFDDRLNSGRLFLETGIVF